VQRALAQRAPALVEVPRAAEEEASPAPVAARWAVAARAGEAWAVSAGEA